MEEPRDYQLISADQTVLKKELAKPDPGATPFKVVVDPEMRLKLRRALIELIDYHDESLAEHFSEGKLALESYKEYIELFARSLKETMESREGIAYLLRSVGFDRFQGRSVTFDVGVQPLLGHRLQVGFGGPAECHRGQPRDHH